MYVIELGTNGYLKGTRAVGSIETLEARLVVRDILLWKELTILLHMLIAPRLPL